MTEQEIEEKTKKIFPKIPHNLTISEKVAIIKQKIDNNYFLNVKFQELQDNENINPLAKPVEQVTWEKLKEYNKLYKTEKANDARVAWCMKSQEDFVNEFFFFVLNNFLLSNIIYK